MTNQQISTDLLYDFLADPTKIQLKKTTAQIINNDNDSDNNESFVIDINNNLNNNSPVLNFNSEKQTNFNNLNLSDSSLKVSIKSKEIKPVILRITFAVLLFSISIFTLIETWILAP